MADRAELEAAAAAGIITADQAERVLAFVAARSGAPAAPSGEEDLRFIRNFHDVFLALGIVLLAAGVAVAAIMFTSPFSRAEGDAAGVWVALAGSFALCAGVMWALAEVFAKRRRLFLPSIAICVAFTGFVIVVALSAYAAVMVDQLRTANPTNWSDVLSAWRLRFGLVVGALAAIGAPAAFYWRFQLPFSMGMAGSGAALLAASLLFLVAPTQFLSALYPLMLVVGLALFAAGVAFDVRDPQRLTRFSDNGFWLHMAAAPLILNGALGCIANLLAPGEFGGPLTGGARGVTLAAANLIIVILLGLVSLLINRRALIVSALLTAGIAVGVLLNAAGLQAMGLATATLLTLGAFVLILGAGWHKARAIILKHAPRGSLMSRIFPPEALE